MAAISEQDRKALLRLARSAIENALTEDAPVERPKEFGPALKEKRGCFVTLHKRGLLRGCIGTIEPVKPLVEGVEENALNAAFGDPRFPSLKTEELGRLHIEVSVLTVPRELSFKDAEDLGKKLKPGIHGVILSKGWCKSTFLPQVWEQLPDVDMFLSHLCVKAGMNADCWRDRDVRVQTYEAEYFSEPAKRGDGA